MPMPSDTTSRPDLMWMVAFHSALRRDLAHLARTASRHRSDDPARRRAVLAGWELFKTQLHIHHTGEDTDLWPRMRTHLSGRPDALPLLQRSLSQAEWQGFVTDQRRKSGIRGAAQFLPWLLDGASAEQTQVVLAELPAPLRVVYRRIWQPRYARHDHWEPSTP